MLEVWVSGATVGASATLGSPPLSLGGESVFSLESERRCRFRFFVVFFNIYFMLWLVL